MGGVLVFIIICNIPILLRLRGVMGRLAFNDDASALVGRFGRYPSERITGVVQFAQQQYTTTTVRETAHHADGTYAGTSTYSVTNKYNSFRLRDSAGRLHDINLVNFGIYANDGDLVTVARVTKRGRLVYLVAINHTVDGQPAYINDHELFRIQGPRQGLLVCWIILSCFSVLGVVISPIALLGPAPSGAYVYYQRRQRQQFIRNGIDPLRAVANDQIRAIESEKGSAWSGMTAR